MTSVEFRRGVAEVLLAAGFVRCGQTFARELSGVSTLLGIERNFGARLSVNVGFWLHALGGAAPKLVEHAHCYFRLERLFPEYRETILDACALDEASQLDAYQRFLETLREAIDSRLRVIGTLEGLRHAFAAGKLRGGLLTKEARPFLLTA